MTRAREDYHPAVGLMILSLVALLLVLVGTVSGALAQENAFQGRPPAAPKRSSSAIAITADGATLLVVNPDSNSLSLVDLGTLPPLTEVPVGVDPRTVAVDDAGAWAYVANRGSDSVSVVDLTAREAITEVAVGDRPCGVVVSPDGTRLYVAEQGIDRLAVLDTTTLEVVDTFSVADRPSGLAISGDGSTLFVTHLPGKTVAILTVRAPIVYFPLF